MRRLKINKGDLLFDIFNTLFLLVILLVVLYPLVYIVSSSFSSPQAVTAGRVWLYPVKPSLAGYKAVFQYKDIWLGYGNSIFYAFFGTIINVVLTIMAAYPLSRSDFRARHAVMFIFTFTMLFEGGLIPTYLVVDKLGMINTRWAMLIPNAVAVWNVIITRTFFQANLSKELHEAAKIDGCGDIKFILSVVIPLSGAIIAVNTLFYAVAHWNQFFAAFIYLQDKNKLPLQIILRTILIMNQVDPSMLDYPMMDVNTMMKRANLRELLKYALIIVASLPVLSIYPFVQKFFVKGIMIGAIKG